ncbi:MAG: transketolase [Brevefilum sp.]
MGQKIAIEKTQELQTLSKKLSRQIIEMTTKAGSGHPSSSVSMIEILIALYFGGVTNHRPHQPDWPERDRFILSKGHGVPALYAVLAESGYFDPEMLMTLREIGSPLEGHPNMRVLPGIEASTGSLGQGLSIGLGHALAARVDGKDYQVYVMIGDGEADEGQIWEAAMTAAKYRVGNLTAILDYNKFQQTGPVKDVMPTLEPLVEKWMSFGWHVTEINGHDFEEIFTAFAMDQKRGEKPHIIIAHTLKGHGLSIFEKDNVNRMHGKPLSESEKDEALREINENYYKENLTSVALRSNPEAQTLQREA